MKEIKLVLTDGSGKNMYVRSFEEDYHCKHGFIAKEDLKQIKDSGVLKTNKGIELFAFRPCFIDVYKKIKRGPQIIPLKDLGSIIAEVGINKNSLVVDAGSGSGALALFLSMIAEKVVSYEVREDFAKIAAENAEFLKINNLKIKRKSVYEGIDESEVDFVTLDLPSPWKALLPAKKALKSGGFLISYSPTTSQVSDFLDEAKKHGFFHLKTIEIIQREWEFSERVVRPKSQAIGHSGFLSYLRNVK